MFKKHRGYEGFNFPVFIYATRFFSFLKVLTTDVEFLALFKIY